MDYAVGDVVRYQQRSGNRTNTYTVMVTKAIATGESFSRSGNNRNCQDFTAAMRLVLEGDDKNVEKIAIDTFINTFATEIDELNTGDYIYSDKIFTDAANGSMVSTTSMMNTSSKRVNLLV